MSEPLRLDLDDPPPNGDCLDCGHASSVSGPELLAVRKKIRSLSAIGDTNAIGWLVACIAIDGGSGVRVADERLWLTCAGCANDAELREAEAVKAAVLEAVAARLGSPSDAVGH